MSIDSDSPQPPLAGLSGPAIPLTPAPDSWLGDLLLACDAASAVGLDIPEQDPSAAAASESGGAILHQRIALAKACLDRLHRRWPWPGASAIEATPAGPLAGLGLTLGRYTLLNLIGSGGHGLVFLADDPTLKRKVALKIPRPEWLASERHRKRFLREAHALARLDHPGIVPIHDFGETGSVCYLATAYVDGPSLADWLIRQPERPVAEYSAHLVLALAEAVEHAHSRGVLHLDLKPGNVLMDWSDGYVKPAPRLTDFGLARLLDETREDNRTETLPFGTPRYMAPEQATYDRSRVGPTTDVYGLGAILHTILTGAAPDGPVDTRQMSLKSRPDVPDALAQILARCLQRSSLDRYPTAKALAEDLRRFADGQSVLARHLGRSRFKRGWDGLANGHRIAIATCFVALAVVVAAAALFSRRPSSQTRQDAIPSRVDPATVTRDLLSERYARDIRLANRLIHDKHDIHTAETEWLDHWAGPFRAGESDPRGFEWGYLENLGHREWMTLRHPDQPDGKPCKIYHVRFSSDGKRVVSSAKDGFARIWDLATGKLVQTLEHSGTEVNEAVFFPDGKRVATASDDGAVRVWDIESGLLILPITQAHRDEVRCLDLTPDGRRLLSGSLDHTLAVWDVATGRELARREAGITEVTNLKISHDGAFAVAGGYREARIAVLDLTDYSLRWVTLPATGAWVGTLDIAPDNRWIATNGGEEIFLVDVTGQSTIRRISAREDRTHTVAFSPDQSFMATIARGNLVKIWDLASGRLRDVLPGHADSIEWVDVSPDGRHLATASLDGTVKVWDTSRRTDRTVVTRPANLGFVAFGATFETNSLDPTEASPALFYGVTPDGRVISIDGRTGKVIDSRTVFPTPIVAARLARDCVAVAGVTRDGSLMIANIAERRAAVTISSQKVPKSATCIAFNANASVLVAASQNPGDRPRFDPSSGAAQGHDILIIDVATGRMTQILEGGSLFPTADYAFLNDGRRLVAHHCYGANDLVVWDLIDGNRRTCPGRVKARRIQALAASPDGKLVATGDTDAKIQIHDTETLILRNDLISHRDGIWVLAFSTDSRRLASGDSQGAIKLWDTATGEELLELEGLEGGTNLLQFAPDGLSLVAATGDGDRRSVTWHGRPRRSEPQGKGVIAR